MRFIHIAIFVFTGIFCLFLSCSEISEPTSQDLKVSESNNWETKTPAFPQFLTILGIAQDAGYPQAGCQKVCCRGLWDEPHAKKLITCLGIVDQETQETWLFEATPDIKFQLKRLADYLPEKKSPLPSGILLTHAHIGHYTGLMQLGHEAMGAKDVPVYAMPKMASFLRDNGPWSQLVEKGNIVLQPLAAESELQLSRNIKITPLIVPHRDEYSETVGYHIDGPKKKVLFIPDIDKWEKWSSNLLEEIKKVDLAFIDGTFYKNGEIPGRDMSLIPHPFIEETMLLMRNESPEERQKIHFIHFNHTNPLLKEESEEFQDVLEKGFKVAKEGATFEL